MDNAAIIDGTRRWIQTMVIGLNLCPFAQRVFKAETIRYAVSDACDETGLREDLVAELRALVLAPIAQVETTLLIHPRVLARFADYNDFLDIGDRLLGELKLRGTIQIASFHPDYQFEGTDADAAENYTNRCPYPMLHLLREASVTQLGRDPVELAEIPMRNIATLRALGTARLLGMLGTTS